MGDIDEFGTPSERVERSILPSSSRSPVRSNISDSTGQRKYSQPAVRGLVSQPPIPVSQDIAYDRESNYSSIKRISAGSTFRLPNR